MKRFLGSIIIILVGLFLYGRYIEPDNFKVNEYTLSNDNIADSFKELTFIQFSDLLYDKDENKLDTLKDKINELNGDIIFFTGDLLNNINSYSEDDYTKIKSFLTSINASLYKFAIIGDNDLKYIDKYKSILDESNFILLDNKNFLLFYKDNTPINIIGINDNYNIDELMQTEVNYNYSICLVHKPDEIVNLKNINLVLAGHSLGGLVNIPYYGGLIKKEGANTYINNYYKIENTELYISNGLGYEDFEFRLFNNPSINVFRFDNNKE